MGRFLERGGGLSYVQPFTDPASSPLMKYRLRKM